MEQSVEGAAPVGIVVVDVRLLVTVLETGGDGVLGDVVVGVFAGHGASGIAGDGVDGGVREGRVCEWWAEAGGPIIQTQRAGA